MGKDEKIFSRMVDANRIRNHEKELAAITAIKKMVTDDVAVTVAGLMEQTRVLNAVSTASRLVRSSGASSFRRFSQVRLIHMAFCAGVMAM